MPWGEKDRYEQRARVRKIVLLGTLVLGIAAAFVTLGRVATDVMVGF